MRVLVTGGAGYLGHAVVSLLLEEGYSVRVFDRIAPSFFPSSVDTQAPDLEVITGDIRRLQETPNLFEGVHAVIHLAALSNDPTCRVAPETAWDINVESTAELARLAIAKGIERFLLASCCTVYGRVEGWCAEETTPPQPVSLLGETKAEAERRILALRNARFEPVVVRLPSLFGLSESMRFDVAVNEMAAMAIRTGRIVVQGGGEQWRPFLHVRDAARAVLTVLQAPSVKVAGKPVNIAVSEQNWKIRNLAERIAAWVGNTLVEIPPDEPDFRSYRVKGDFLTNALGFRPMYTLEDGLAEIQAWLTQFPQTEPFDAPYMRVKRFEQLLSTPAELGGEPVAPQFIPLARPVFGKEEEEAVLQTLRSGWLTSGPHIRTFEQMFSELVEAPHAVATCSCTAAIHLCLALIGVKPGDEVITPPITWASTGNTILNMGARPVFVDVEPTTLNLDPERLEEAITDRTKAIIPVHMAGQPCRLSEIYRIAEKYNIPVIEDAAHALGAAYRKKPIGAHGRFTCFSFYAIKNITTIEGGMITSPEAETAERLRLLATNGMSATAWDRYGRSAVPHPPEVIVPGFKYALGNVHAALGIEQLRRFPSFKEKRKRLAELYREMLADTEEIRLLEVQPEVEHAWHLFIVRLRLNRLNATRDEIAHLLRKENVGTGVHFYGLHLHEYYREVLKVDPARLPVATAVSQDILSLPLYPGMDERQVEQVVKALKKVLYHARKK